MKIPILDAYDTGNSYICYCPFCEKYHTHGRGAGHRAAHCPSKRIAWSNDLLHSPFHSTGYILKLKGPATPAILRQYQRQRDKLARKGHETTCLQGIQYVEAEAYVEEDD